MGFIGNEKKFEILLETISGHCMNKLWIFEVFKINLLFLWTKDLHYRQEYAEVGFANMSQLGIVNLHNSLFQWLWQFNMC